MNIISLVKSGRKKVEVLDPGSQFRKALRLFRRNRLHESENILLKLKHHGYSTPQIDLLLARVYDRLAFLTSEIEFEDKARNAYNDIINYSKRKRYVKRAGLLLKKLEKRIEVLDDNEHRARFKAGEFKRKEPNSPKAWFILGANFSARKDPQFVIRAYENALSLHKNYIAALFRIAYIYQYNLNDYDSALTYYHRLVKIPPYEDTFEPESANVKTILETCNEMSGIYCALGRNDRVLSVFDLAMDIYRTYGDICSPHNIKKILCNTRQAAISLNKYQPLLKYCRERFGADFEGMLKELGII